MKAAKKSAATSALFAFHRVSDTGTPSSNNRRSTRQATPYAMAMTPFKTLKRCAGSGLSIPGFYHGARGGSVRFDDDLAVTGPVRHRAAQAYCTKISCALRRRALRHRLPKTHLLVASRPLWSLQATN